MRAIVILFIAVIGPGQSLAGDVFTWTDDEGVVNFSQWAPQYPASITTLKTISGNPDEYNPTTDPYSIQNQAERVNKTWTKVEERNAELRKRREDAEERMNQLQPPTYYYPPYQYGYTNYRSILRPPVYRPVQPIYPAPYRPHARKIQQQQISTMNKLNRRPNQRVPYSSVTGVSQRATIHHLPQD